MKTKSVSRVSRKGSRRARAEAAAARARIVAAARALFLERGFLRTTSDDIAAELGISKATLYRTFRSKEEILRAVVRETMAEILAGVEGLIRDGSRGFVEKMAALFAHLATAMAQFGPNLVRDVQRAAPNVWKEIHDFRRDKILKNFRIILESGRREGYFRDDVDLDLLLRMFLSLVQQLVTPDEVRRTGRSPAAIFESVIKVFFQGILTDKGRQDFYARTPALFEPRKEGAL
ncbi:MAG TPA: TetR/AcrR family transcriptional regulator [Acidobacteriota bacterium]|nr:TetR/AcrR family transcriptional regulator [Acidobacteriota bacterium]